MVLLRVGCACGGVAEVPKLGCLIRRMSASEVKAGRALLLLKLRFLTRSGLSRFRQASLSTHSAHLRRKPKVRI
jgi:hypothetical protein